MKLVAWQTGSEIAAYTFEYAIILAVIFSYSRILQVLLVSATVGPLLVFLSFWVAVKYTRLCS